MAEYRLTHKVRLEQITEFMHRPGQQVVTAVNTCWWSLWEEAWLPYKKGGIPCDPRGSMLFQGEATKFWTAATANPEHYGRNGLQSLVAAFHSNVEVRHHDGVRWLPTSFEGWEKYNELLDQFRGV